MNIADNRTLVVYHSIQGNTEKVAKALANILKADIKKINVHQKSSGSAIRRSPRILAQMYGLESIDTSWIDIKAYDKIIIGSPCWMYQVTLPVRKFIQDNDFSGKKVGLFITHGGDYGETSKRFEALMPQCDYMGMLEYQVVNENFEDRLINDSRRFTSL